MHRKTLTFLAFLAFLVAPAAASAAGQQLPPTPQGGGLDSVQCWAVGHCMAVGGSAKGVLVDRLSGTRWSIVNAPNPKGGDQTASLVGLSCIGSRWCLAVGSNRCGGPSAERWNGKDWSLVNVDLPMCKSSILEDLSCASKSFCMATDSGTASVVTWNGRTWTPQKVTTWFPPGDPPTSSSPNIFTGVSCVAHDVCAESGYGDFGFTSVVGWYNGHGLKVDDLNEGDADPSGGMGSVSCSSTRFCMAVGVAIVNPSNSNSFGAAIAWNGSSWGTETFPSSLLDPIAVSCASKTNCVAANVNPGLSTTPSFATFNGKGWVGTPSAFTAQPTDISCPVTGWCMVVGEAAVGDNGSTPAAGIVR